MGPAFLVAFIAICDCVQGRVPLQLWPSASKYHACDENGYPHLSNQNQLSQLVPIDYLLAHLVTNYITVPAHLLSGDSYQ